MPPLCQVWVKTSFEKGGQGVFEAFLNPPKSPFSKGGLACIQHPQIRYNQDIYYVDVYIIFGTGGLWPLLALRARGFFVFLYT